MTLVMSGEEFKDQLRYMASRGTLPQHEPNRRATMFGTKPDMPEEDMKAFQERLQAVRNVLAEIGGSVPERGPVPVSELSITLTLLMETVVALNERLKKLEPAE
jgi:hypothetical protein